MRIGWLATSINHEVDKPRPWSREGASPLAVEKQLPEERGNEHQKDDSTFRSRLASLATAGMESNATSYLRVHGNTAIWLAHKPRVMMREIEFILQRTKVAPIMCSHASSISPHLSDTTDIIIDIIAQLMSSHTSLITP